MENIKYVTSDKLKSYLDLVEKIINGECLPPAVLLTFDGKLSKYDNEKLDLIFTGIRVHIRVMQGIDVDTTLNPDWQSNIDFFYQTPGTFHGNRGKKFAETLKTGLDLKGNKQISFSEVAKTLINKLPTSGPYSALPLIIIEQILNVVFDFSGQAQRRAEDFSNGMSNLFQAYQSFMKDYADEYEKQYPPLIDPTTTPKTNPIDNTNNQNNSSTNTKNTNNNNNLTGSTNSNIVIILLIVFVFILLLRKKQTPKKRKK